MDIELVFKSSNLLHQSPSMTTIQYDIRIPPKFIISYMTDWHLPNIHFSNDNGSFPFYLRLFSIHYKTLLDLRMSNMACPSQKQELLTHCKHASSHHFLCEFCSSFQFHVLCFVMYPMLPVSLDCSFWITSSDFSDIYLSKTYWYKRVYANCFWIP